MRQITTLNNSSHQQFDFALEGYDSVRVYLEFKPQQYGWFMTLTWGSFVLSNERLSVSDNLLRQFRDMIPFGIMITGIDAIDPSSIDSWIDNNFFYFLTADEVLEVEATAYVRS